MQYKWLYSASIFIIFASLIISCGAVSPATVSTETAASVIATEVSTTVAGDPFLAQALTMAPITAQTVRFTNWDMAKSFMGMSHLSGQNSIADRADFYRSMHVDWSAFSFRGAQFLECGPQCWSMDGTDLMWEASVSFSPSDSSNAIPPNVGIFQFPDTFDLSPVIQHFDEYGFHHTVFQDTDIYTHTTDVTELWSRVGSNIFNVAVLPDNHQLLLASDIDSLYKVIDVVSQNAPSLSQDDAIPAIVEQLGSVLTAEIRQASYLCNAASYERIMERLKRNSVSKAREIEEQLSSHLSAVRPYDMWALGYRVDDEAHLGVMAFYYDDVDSAQADYEHRLALAEDGWSLSPGKPYKESVFIVKDSLVQEHIIRLDINPYNNLPNKFNNILTMNNFFFAICPQ